MFNPRPTESQMEAERSENTRYITVSHAYGRHTEKINLDAFAADLAAALGGTLEQPEPGYHTSCRIAFPEAGLCLSVSSGWRKSEARRVTVSAHITDVRYDDRPCSDGRGTYKMPEATVSIDRPMAKIAADVKRRVIDAAERPSAAIRAYAAKRAVERDDLAAAIKRIVSAVPEMAESRNGPSDNYRRQLHWMADGIHMSAYAYSTGHVSVERLGTVSAAAFIEICEVLRRHSPNGSGR
jgi:hypothetical protein